MRTLFMRLMTLSAIGLLALAGLAPIYAVAQTATGITITSPAGGENWTSGSTHTITWSAPASVSTVGISLQSFLACMDANPPCYIAISNTPVAANVANTGSFSWTIPANLSAGEYKLTIADTAGSTTGRSNPFSISAATDGTIAVTTPAGGENWAAASTQTIRWSAPSSVSAVNISLRNYFACQFASPPCMIAVPMFIIQIASNAANSGIYNWAIPAAQAAGQYQLTVSDAGSSGLSGTSQAFTVSSASSGSTTLADGTLVIFPGSPTVYLVINGTLYPFSSARIFLARGLRWSDIRSMDRSQIGSTPVSSLPVFAPDGSIIKGSSATVYLVSGGKKLGLPSLAVFNRLRLSWSNLIMISDSELAGYPDGGIQY